MTLTEALSKINAPKGFTSIIAGVSNGDYSVLPKESTLKTSMEEADSKIALYQKQMSECKSDWSYWSILGDLEYWKAIKNILEAAELVGENNLPDVEKKEGVVVMDAIGAVSDFGKMILHKAKVSITAKQKLL